MKETDIKIYHSVQPSEQDRQVPQFGSYRVADLHEPQRREVIPVVVREQARTQLYQSAMDRSLYFSYGLGHDKPHVQFPNAEHFQNVPFTHGHWDLYGDMESESARLFFTLEEYQGRGFPVEYDGIANRVLESDDVLQAWGEEEDEINSVAKRVYFSTLEKMEATKQPDNFGYKNQLEGAYHARPVLYETSDQVRMTELYVWDAGLRQMTDELQAGKYDNVTNFLSLYNRIKDPVSPLNGLLERQAEIFTQLYEQAREKLRETPKDEVNERVLVTQLALESSFLALPAVDEVAGVAYGSVHEMPFVYVDLTKVPRGEFADPKRVTNIMKELIDRSKQKMVGEDTIPSNGNVVAAMTPITVSYFQEPGNGAPKMFIVDGNNRATAVLLMKFVSEMQFDLDRVNNRDELFAFVAKHALDIEWERDIAVTVDEIMQNHQEMFRDLCKDNVSRSIMHKFGSRQTPAHLVQEPNFHTIAVELSNERDVISLQSAHQAMFNGRSELAITSKKQSHGRCDEVGNLEISVGGYVTEDINVALIPNDAPYI